MTNTANTLASRAASLLTKAASLAIVEKALNQAIAAKRVYPPLAEDFGTQLGLELPLKTKDFTRVVGNLLASSEKPMKGAITKKKHEILSVLAELVAALTDTAPITLPDWVFPKERTKKTETEASVKGALQRANEAAAANEAAESLAAAAVAEAKTDNAVAKAVAVIVANAATLTDDQRQALLLALGAEVTESAEA